MHEKSCWSHWMEKSKSFWTFNHDLSLKFREYKKFSISGGHKEVRWRNKKWNSHLRTRNLLVFEIFDIKQWKLQFQLKMKHEAEAADETGKVYAACCIQEWPQWHQSNCSIEIKKIFVVLCHKIKRQEEQSPTYISCISIPCMLNHVIRGRKVLSFMKIN